MAWAYCEAPANLPVPSTATAVTTTLAGIETVSTKVLVGEHFAAPVRVENVALFVLALPLLLTPIGAQQEGLVKSF